MRYEISPRADGWRCGISGVENPKEYKNYHFLFENPKKFKIFVLVRNRFEIEKIFVEKLVNLVYIVVKINWVMLILLLKLFSLTFFV